MGSWSIGHWLILLLIVVLVFGTKRLRNIGSDLGGAMKDFRKGLHDGEHGPEPQLKADPEPVVTSTPASDTKRDQVP